MFLAEITYQIDKKKAFEPRIGILLRITSVLIEKNSTKRTDLAQTTDMNYSRLAKYLEWLEHRSFVEFILESGKVFVRLTPSGREFSQKILKTDSAAF